ncbi:MAG: TMAO reductase system periplasmic protein TorT, partial [Hyphomicrobiales bacterium]
AGNTGFGGAISGSAVDLVETKYGDTGKEAQAKLVEDTLEAHPDLSYIVGTAVTAEAAVPILRSRGLTDQVKIVSYYYTPGVDRGIARGQILAAPTDSTVVQGRIAIDQAVRILEGKDYQKHVGPALTVVTQDNHSNFDATSTLAPDGFRPVFSVE